MAEGFNKKGNSYPESSEEEIRTPYVKIGQLTVERNFLENAFRRLGLGGLKKWSCKTIPGRTPNDVYYENVTKLGIMLLKKYQTFILL